MFHGEPKQGKKPGASKALDAKDPLIDESQQVGPEVAPRGLAEGLGSSRAALGMRMVR